MISFIFFSIAKGLIGLPGDQVQMINNVLHINGEPVRDVVLNEQDAENMYGMPVIKARETLPEGFQRAEFLLEKGAIDMIVDRREMRDRLASILTLLQRVPAV